MEPAIVLYDETTGGERREAMRLRLVSSRITARDLLRMRIEREVAAYNRERAGYFQGLVQPRDAESELNGYRLRKRRQLDSEEQFAEACRAFERNGFLLLFDDRQVEDLDEELMVTEEAELRFLKLVPLVGG